MANRLLARVRPRALRAGAMARRIMKPASSKSATEWAHLVAEWRRSGKSGRDFAALRGLSPATLIWWSWRLRTREGVAARARASNPPLKLVELLVDRSVSRGESPTGRFTSPRDRVEIDSSSDLTDGDGGSLNRPRSRRFM